MPMPAVAPLIIVLTPTCTQVAELKYSPLSTGDGGMLAAGCNDMAIYVYSCKHDYQLVSKVGPCACLVLATL